MLSMEENSFRIILKGGNGKSFAMEAIGEAKMGRFTEARELLDQAASELIEAHHIQSELIRQEVNGNEQPLSLLLIHAQDHLMNAMTVKDLASEMVEMYERFQAKGAME
ncbi:PTS lactose/cellobiose transporter subunit IIA [Falsibacillus albus]|uniref:PTS lactose/cellobiose transporter subunit IIA n=1 Tax=Falsibacillus albus TaxID=2478915 RepID=A0A3L7JYS1_9BACI|nr:PTS lactose/cellobiose transporter subunit IIA [Falsibacillus albus]